MAVKPGTSDTDTITYEICARRYPGTCSNVSYVAGGVRYVTFPGMVYGATRNGVRTQYHFQPGAGPVNVLGSTNPYRGNSQVLTHNGYAGQPENGSLRQVDRPGIRAYFSGNRLNRMTEHIRTGSIRETYSYDSRRNLTSRLRHPKDGDTTAPLLTTIDYEAACTNIVICNKPRFTIDPKSNRTDYDHYPTHGGIRSVTGPAVEVITASGQAMVRPQTRYEYVARTPWLKTADGGYAAGPAVQMLAKESFCRTSAATGNPSAPCATAGDQVETVHEYGPDSGPNNLLVRGVATTADGVTIRTCFAYDRFGNKISETTPRGTGASQCP
ncbi:MAG TPA: hypothetical protein VEA60_06820 [Allosphingosinicella sp.]|nr:hypothetical protein [Allosphingosinicella sp.]